MSDDLHHVTHRARWRNPFACRTCPFLEPDSHLSLGEIDRREALRLLRRKLTESGVSMSLEEDAAWAALNRVPRRPPIYRDDPASKGAA